MPASAGDGAFGDLLLEVDDAVAVVSEYVSSFLIPINANLCYFVDVIYESLVAQIPEGQLFRVSAKGHQGHDFRAINF